VKPDLRVFEMNNRSLMMAVIQPFGSRARHVYESVEFFQYLASSYEVNKYFVLNEDGG